MVWSTEMALIARRLVGFEAFACYIMSNGLGVQRLLT